MSEIIINRVAGAWHSSLPGYRKLVAEWCKASLEAKHKGELAIVLADDAFVQNLNHRFRGLNKPTNVLSFPGSDGALGDVVLAYQTVRTEARAQNKTFKAHTAHMIVHGCLHLQGYDHETVRDANRMETLEKEILALLGFPNPYMVS